MDPGFRCKDVQEKEDELLAFVSYNPKVDFEHVYWLPHDLMLYALRTDRDLRSLFKDSYVEMENLIDANGEQEYLVKLFLMEEYTYKGKLVKMFWIGIILNPPEESNAVDVTGFHGTILACALQYSRHPLLAMFRGPRHVPAHKLEFDECYYGTWNKSNIYTGIQRFGRQGSATFDLTVITIIAVEADSTRIANRGKTKSGVKRTDVLIGKGTVPKVIMFRPDNETQTLRACDRCMGDYQRENVKQMQATWQEENRKVPPPWRLDRAERQPDAELQKNSEDMQSFARQPGVEPEKFCT